MAYVILPSRRKRPDIFELDYGHPLAQGLVFGIFGGVSGTPRDSSPYRENISTGGGARYLYGGENRPLLRFTGATGETLGAQSNQVRYAEALTVSSMFFSNVKDSAYRRISDGFSQAKYQFVKWNTNTIDFSVGTVVSSSRAIKIPSTSWNAQSWHHASFSYDGTLRSHLDGKMLQEVVHNEALRTDIVSPGVFISIGSTNPGAQIWSGALSDFCIHNRALSQEEIAILANKTDPMLAGMIRDKKPAPKHWFMPIPDDCKVKSVVPVRAMGGSPFGVGVQLPRVKRRPDVFELDHSHPLAQGLVFGGLGNLPGSLNYFDSGPLSAHGLMYNKSARDWFHSKDLGRAALSFNNTNSHVSTPTSISHGIGVNPFSAGGWVFGDPSRGTNKAIFCLGNYAPVLQSMRATSPHNVSAFIGSWREFSSIVQDNKWSHVFFTVDSAGLCKAYIDGFKDPVEIGEVARPAVTNSIIRVGWDGSTAWARGPLADVCCYNRALSPAEIALLADRTDPMLDGLIRPAKPRTIYSFASKHNIVGTQDANTLNWTWGNKL